MDSANVRISEIPSRPASRAALLANAAACSSSNNASDSTTKAGEIVSEPCDHSDGGEIVVTCWKCGETRCEDCATKAEIRDQCCSGCLKEVSNESEVDRE